ncbi:GDP-mannose 4,6-dehydratase [Faecalicoccus pleomorphus]|uniref:GDP-mannose 4,6-dehydratase n=1 Tax=Faecalicoccus pleomorphus TaxID=1323 RepID=UPI0039F48484
MVTEIFEKYKPQIVVNLEAQAGVCYSITNPDAYIESNLIGFYNILEACCHSYDNDQTVVPISWGLIARELWRKLRLILRLFRITSL